MKPKSIGIVGGLGAAASADCAIKLYAHLRSQYGCSLPRDFPKFALENLSSDILDETGVANEGDAIKTLQEAAQRLEMMGAQAFGIVCNTVHIYAEQIQAAVNIPLISIVEECAEVAKDRGFKTVGIVGSQTTLETGLYQRALAMRGVKALEVESHTQPAINSIIESVMGGKQGQHEAKLLADMAGELSDDGAQAVILGCTELPLAVKQADTSVELIDSIHVLSEALVKFSFSDT